MALVATTTLSTMLPDRYMILGTLAFDSSYPTGGESVTAAILGFSDPNFDLFLFPHNGYTFKFDKANGKVLVYDKGLHTHDLYLKDAGTTYATSAAVLGAAAALGANTGTSLTVTGLTSGSTAHGGVRGVDAAALQEVADTTSLSALTGVPFMALGRKLA